MTQFVSTLGFSGHRVTRPIIAYGLTNGDEIVLLAPEQDDPTAEERTQTAIRDVEETLCGVVHRLTISTERVAVDDFQAATDRISAMLVDGPSPVVCLGAGATDVMLPTFLATLAHANHVRDVMVFSDLERGGVNPDLPNLLARVPGRATDLFRALADQMDGPPATVSELAEIVDCSVSTASRHVDALAREGLVKKDRNEQAKTVSLTVTGRMFARNLLLEEEGT